MPFRFDETDPNLLIVYTGDDHAGIAEYYDLVQRWKARSQKAGRFGVIIVNEPHDHDHDEEDEDHRQDEEAFTQLINDFRRDYRLQANASTFGFAEVYDIPSIQKYLDLYEDGWSHFREMAVGRAYYVYGTRGDIFSNLEDAIAWMQEIRQLPPVDLSHEIVDFEQSGNRVALFYGSTTGTTEKVAFEIRDAWNTLNKGAIEPLNIGYLKNPADLLLYDYLILGVPTWNIGQLQDDWKIIYPKLEQLDLSGKKIALFGIGDQYGYPENFQDALGILGNKLRERGATLIGFWDASDYEFISSLGVENGKFMGLAVDDMHQPELTASRIERWVNQIMHEFSFEPITF